MPKATLEFQLPEESEEHEMAVKAGDYRSALREFGQFLRSRYKHGPVCETGAEELETIRAEFLEYTLGLLDD